MSFYCQKVCGDKDFSIEEWNKAYKYCDDAGIKGIERDKILNPELFPCIEQCEACMNVVIDTQSNWRDKFYLKHEKDKLNKIEK